MQEKHKTVLGDASYLPPEILEVFPREDAVSVHPDLAPGTYIALAEISLTAKHPSVPAHPVAEPVRPLLAVQLVIRHPFPLPEPFKTGQGGPKDGGDGDDR